MTDTDPIKRAHTLITDLNKAYQACKQASADDVRFQEQLNSILGFLAKAETVDNRFLIELEKFYQTSSLLMGLSALDPDAPTRAAWRAYDRFHYPVVTKKKLRQTELNFFFSVVSAMLVLHLTFYLIRQIQD